MKTRLQVEARKGQTHYKGLTDAFVKICKLRTFSFVTVEFLIVPVAKTERRASRHSSKEALPVYFVAALNSGLLSLHMNTCTRQVFD